MGLLPPELPHGGQEGRASVLHGYMAPPHWRVTSRFLGKVMLMEKGDGVCGLYQDGGRSRGNSEGAGGYVCHPCYLWGVCVYGDT